MGKKHKERRQRYVQKLREVEKERDEHLEKCRNKKRLRAERDAEAVKTNENEKLGFFSSTNAKSQAEAEVEREGDLLNKRKRFDGAAANGQEKNEAFSKSAVDATAKKMAELNAQLKKNKQLHETKTKVSSTNSSAAKTTKLTSSWNKTKPAADGDAEKPFKASILGKASSSTASAGRKLRKY